VNEPQTLSGDKPIHNWLNRLLAFCRSNTPLESPTLRLEKTANGFRYTVKDAGGGGSRENPKRTWVIRVNGVLRDVQIDAELPTAHET